ncbi:MAG: molecular chaperone DnaJ [Rhodospirillales bacterium]|jgi:molecular chaperone DnaJ|nr:molecular chaperone DnaJ [Rhodospirillales bacterium]
MAKQDYYNALGVARDASADEIKKSYRKLAMKYHPDRNSDGKGDDKKFKEINEAYDVLKDDQRRAAYDRFGHAAFEAGGPGAAGGGGFEGGFTTRFADIFDEMFGDFANRQGGTRRGSGGPSRGSDLRYNMEVSLADAYSGKKASIRVPTSVPCASCKGSGSAGGAAPTTCPTCHGQGRERAQSGFFTVERTCPSCQGVGQVIRDPCKACSGTGRTHKEKTLSVNIPAGVEDGTRIRLAGEGEASLRGAPAGDLYIFLSVASHRLFHRDGANIHCRVPIAFTTAALGGAIEVPTVDGGRARVTIPAGTQTGNQFRLKGKGMAILRSKARGDMFVQASVETPVNLTKKQKDLLHQFEQDGGSEQHSPESHGFFTKVKELWEDLKE